MLRLLLSRKDLNVNRVTSERLYGRPVHEVHPNLRGFTDLKFSRIQDMEGGDVLFLALPHGNSQKMIEKLRRDHDKIIDLSADYRLSSKEVYRKWYGTQHLDPDNLGSFIYGIPEIHRGEISSASTVAGPGCIAAASILALYPFRFHAKRVLIDAKIGSSAAGNTANSSTHHPERSGVIRPYAPVSHRHEAEIRQETGLDVSLTVSAVEMVRGISATIHMDMDQDFNESEAWKKLRNCWNEEPFIRFVKSRKGIYRYPEPKLVAGTNLCDIGFEWDGDHSRLVVFSCIDNLVKGAAGSAIQSMNLMIGVDECEGLLYPGLHP